MRITGYRDLERLHDGGQAVVYRAVRDADGARVVLKLLRGPYPTTAQRARFRQEFDITRRLQGKGVVTAYALVEIDGLPMIVLEDTGSSSLERLWRDAHPPLHVAIDVAIGIVEAMQRVHAAKVLHLDLNPSNVIYSPHTGDIRLIDFGMSTDLPRLSASLRAEQVLGGTLRWTAPEQTGRMNRSVDYRSDHYAIGATLYWLFSGAPPFEATDPLTLVHAHIARTPAPIPDVPQALSDVVLKLLEKGAEDRYQSAHGLLVDLRHCRAIVQGDAHGLFVPGAEDRPARFAIPEKLYGRSVERHLLLDAFHRAAEGGREVVWVAGRSGMGKTALVEEVQRPIASRNGTYLAAKFDQFKRGVPYGSLGDALRPFVRRLLTGQQGEVTKWQDRLGGAVSPNGRLLTDLIPELEMLLGPQPALPELPPLEAEQRLHRTVRLFLRSLASEEHPLTLFLDDLQWADLPSLSLLRVMATDAGSSHVLLIGAYRAEEVGREHHLRRLAADLEGSDVSTSTIELVPLAVEHVQELLSDTLWQSRQDLAPIARFAQGKTAGNPFFLHRFLHSLVDAELLSYDGASGRWSWDLEGIEALDVTDNVVAFLAERLGRLPADAREPLEAAAVAGAVFGLALLAAALQLPQADVRQALRPALQAGLIEQIQAFEDDATFRFLHDRVQQAAYERTTDATRRALHRRFGELLLGATDNVGQSEALFDVVNHLNAGAWDDPRLAELNEQAGRRALSASAYAPASDYLSRALQLRGPDAWERRPESMRTLTETAARAAYLQSDHERMEALLQDAEAHARDDLDRVRAQRIRMDALIMQNRAADAVAIGLKALRLVGVDLPDAPTESDIGEGLQATFARLEGVDLGALPERPPPDDAAALLAMELLSGLGPPAYFINQALVPMLGIELVRWTLEKGPTAESSYGFALLGLVLCDVGHIEAGYGFGEVSWALAGRFDDQRMRVRSGHVWNGFSRHWKEPVPPYLPEYHRLYEQAVDIGDFEYAGYIGMMRSIFDFYTAEDLGQATTWARHYAAAMEESQQLNSLAVHGMVYQAMLNLIERTDDPVLLTGAVFDEPSMLAVFQKLNDPTCLFVIHCLKSTLAAFHGRWRECVDLASTAESYVSGATATIHKVVMSQWSGLAAATLARSGAADREALLARAEKALERLNAWAEQNPMTHGHRPGLVRGALAAARGDRQAALSELEATVTLARDHQSPAELAVALRTAGEVCHEAGWTTAARGFLIEARGAFLAWGASSPSQQLDRTYPALLGNLTEGSPLSVTSTSVGSPHKTGTSGIDLDTSAVIRASQAVAKEIELPALVQTVIRLSMEVSGATGAVLIRAADVGGWTVTGVGRSAPEPSVDATSVPLSQADVVPRGVVNLVARTREELIVQDASSARLTVEDPYVVAQGIRSLLCVPIEQQGRLKGLLYLEHRGASGVFTQERVALLRVLLAQAAIAVENAELVDTLEEKVRARTAQLAAANDAKTRFLRSMSHELRTPLNGILGYAQLLLDDDGLSHKQQEGLGTIRRSGTHLLSLINDILDMNKIEAGKLDLVPAPMPLQGFLEGLVHFAIPDAQRKGLAMVVRGDPELPQWIEADAKRLRQIVLNLVGNAVKFTDAGSVTVSSEGGGRGLRVVVEDTGPGIATDRLESIFDPFEQAGGAELRSKGTGLGLAIARQLARQMGGELSAHSVPGCGSRFVLDVPLVSCDAPEDAPVPEVVEPTPSPPPRAQLAYPDRDVLRRLLELAREGAYRTVSREVAELATADPTLRTFANALGAMARDFDEEGVERLLEEGLD